MRIFFTFMSVAVLASCNKENQSNSADTPVRVINPPSSPTTLTSALDTNSYFVATVDGEPLKLIYPYSAPDLQGSIYDSTNMKFVRFESRLGYSTGNGKKAFGIIGNIAALSLPHKLTAGQFIFNDCSKIAEYEANPQKDTTQFWAVLGFSGFEVIISDTANGVWKGTFGGDMYSNGKTKKIIIQNGEFSIKSARVPKINL